MSFKWRLVNVQKDTVVKSNSMISWKWNNKYDEFMSNQSGLDKTII